MAPTSHIASFDAIAPARRTAQVAYRDGDSGDAEAVAALAHAVYGGDADTWRHRTGAALTRPDTCLVLAIVGGEPVGYGKAAWCEPRDAADAAPAGIYLTGLVVLPAWRRCGIGQELTRRRLAWVWQRGQAAWFFTNARNRTSLVLHERLGFVEVGRAASYLGEPFDGGVGVLMRAEDESWRSDAVDGA